MGRNITIDARRGGGAAHEVLLGEVSIEPTILRNDGAKIVFPDYTKEAIEGGLATLENVDASPAGPEPAWAYKVTFQNYDTGRFWTELVGVPEGTSAITYASLTRFTTAIPPETTKAELQNWVATTETNADRSEVAAAAAEAPTDLMNKNLIEDPASLTATALSAAIDASIAAIPEVPALPKPIFAVTSPVAYVAKSDGSAGPTGIVTTDFRPMSDAAREPWFSTPVDKDSSWIGNEIIYPGFGASSAPPWGILGLKTNSLRVYVLGTIHTGRNAGPWVFVDGAPLSRTCPDYALTYSANYASLLITFPDARNRTVEIFSPWGISRLSVDTGATIEPYRKIAPSLGIIGDSWIGGTSQGGVVPIPAHMQVIAPWRIWASGSGGSGYTVPGSGVEFTAATRLDVMLGKLPDVLLMFGSINDGPTAITSGVNTVITKRDSISPTTKLIFVGPQLPSSDQRNRLAEMNAAVAGKPGILGVVDPTGWVIPGVVGPTDMAHPSPYGVQLVAENLMQIVKRLALASGDVRW